MGKVFSVQNRLQRIRNGFAPINKQNQFQGVQRIRLHRATSVPRNYTVRVPNTPITNFNFPKHSIKKELNPRLQNEIKLIQSQNQNEELIDFNESMPVVATAKTLHHRFSLLP